MRRQMAGIGLQCPAISRKRVLLAAVAGQDMPQRQMAFEARRGNRGGPCLGGCGLRQACLFGQNQTTIIMRVEGIRAGRYRRIQQEKGFGIIAFSQQHRAGLNLCRQPSRVQRQSAALRRQCFIVTAKLCKHDAEIIEGLPVIRLELDRFAISFFRSGKIVAPLQYVAQMVPESGGSRFCVDRFTQQLFGLRKLIPLSQQYR